MMVDIKRYDSTKILKKIRQCMTDGEQTDGKRLDALIIPSNDAHMSSYLLAKQDRRREYVSGFTGGHGTAVITLTHAAVWTNGSWHDQAEYELDSNWELIKEGWAKTPTVEEWICSNVPTSSTIGINTNLCSIQRWNVLENALSVRGNTLVGVNQDIVDAVWVNKSDFKTNEITVVGLEESGESFESKIKRCRDAMKSKEADWLLLTSLDDISWLVNIRGNDIEHNTVFFSYLAMSLDAVHLFIRPSLSVVGYMHSINMVPHNYNEFYEFLNSECSGTRVWLTESANQSIKHKLDNCKLITTLYSPVCLMKTVKNSIEIEGMKRANLLDAVAFCQFLNWIEHEVLNGSVTECSAANKLVELRKLQEGYICCSFDILSASGPNTSFAHHSPLTLNADRIITAQDIYYNDSGGHFTFGTTDTTRTVHFGMPSQYQKRCFTLVLKGFIAVSAAVFPCGTRGHMIDTLARKYLWENGMDYGYGTGHGVGHGRNVVEGPGGIAINKGSEMIDVSQNCELKPGMTITVEPGFHEKGNFGVRVENTLLCVAADPSFTFNGASFLKFETITHIPIQRKMIEVSMLTKFEVDWLNNYHNICWEYTGKELIKQNKDDPTIEWIKEQTKSIEYCG